jgi:hypothetical protein
MTGGASSAAPSPLSALLELARSLLSLLLWLLAGAASLLARGCGLAFSLVPAQRRRPLALAAGALLFAAALYGAMVFPQRAALDSWRRLRQYWGVGWCEPYSPPRVEHSFAPAQGPGLTWAGDADFWREFPCARESYRVVLPDGEVPHLSAAAAAAAAAAATGATAAAAAAAAEAGDEALAAAAAAAAAEEEKRGASPSGSTTRYASRAQGKLLQKPASPSQARPGPCAGAKE